jgi:hypothetical protein
MRPAVLLLLICSPAIVIANTVAVVTRATYGENCPGFDEQAAAYQDMVIGFVFNEVTNKCSGWGDEGCTFVYDREAAGGDTTHACSTKRCAITYECDGIIHEYQTPKGQECSGSEIHLRCDYDSIVSMAQAVVATRINNPEGAGKTEENKEILLNAERKLQAAANAQEEVVTAKQAVAAAKKASKTAKVAAMNAVEAGASEVDIKVANEIAELDVAAADAALEAAEAAADQAEAEAAEAEKAAGEVRMEAGAGRIQFVLAAAGEEMCPSEYTGVVDVQTCKQAAAQFSLTFQLPDVESGDVTTSGNQAAAVAAVANETDLCRTHVAKPGEVMLSSLEEAGGPLSNVICEVNPVTVTINSATYGADCSKYDPEEGYEEGMLKYLEHECTNSSTQRWLVASASPLVVRERCEFKFINRQLGADPAPGCPKRCNISWTCGFNESRSLVTDAGADCMYTLLKINCDERPGDRLIR